MRKVEFSWLKILILAILVAACLNYPVTVSAADEPALTKEQIKQFLLTAKVVHTKSSDKGVTHSSRLTLSDGTVTHDASFQPVDERKAMADLGNGRREMNFVDSYKYNLAAYVLAEIVGFDDMMPVYVERKVDGHSGSLSWWLTIKMDDAQRMQQKLEPPDSEAWNSQMYKIRVFDALVYDTDPNLTNVLIGPDWKLWRIDFSRAFRTYHEVPSTKDLVRCPRQFFESLKALNMNELADKAKPYLTKDEIKAVMARRDKIVDTFQKLIAQKGEKEVLY